MTYVQQLLKWLKNSCGNEDDSKYNDKFEDIISEISTRKGYVAQQHYFNGHLLWSLEERLSAVVENLEYKAISMFLDIGRVMMQTL